MRLKEYENRKRKVEIVILVIITLLVIAIGVSYALWILTKEQTGENVVNTSCLNVTIENEADDISLKNTFPKLDEEGLNSKPYKFTIKNNCEEYADYKISLEMLGETTINSEYIKISLNEEQDEGLGVKLSEYKQVDNLTVDGAKEKRQIKKGKLKPSEEKKYELRIWIDEDVTKEDGIENETYKSKIVVESVLGEKPYTEDILHGTDPVLDGDLIPITINEENGAVTRADESKKWYSYNEQQWANAVILRDGIEDPGKNQPINENDIESYFVWIPRYKYRLKEDEETFNSYDGEKESYTVENVEQFYDAIGGNKGATSPFEIEFESKDKEIQNGSKQGEWLTHPAFVSFNSNGMWVGKFESSTTINNENNDNSVFNVINPETLKIKPNVRAWEYIDVAHAFYNSYQYKRELDSHMMKNTEWGAIAYLTNSKYGRCDGNNCSAIRINSSINTGSAAQVDPTCHLVDWGVRLDCNPFFSGKYWNYFNSASNIASTTNNYYGIYDMVGGGLERVMGVMKASATDSRPLSGKNSENNSGFNGPYGNGEGEKTDGLDFPKEKYYDLYEYNDSIEKYSKGKLGDATKEMGPFYRLTYNIDGNIVTYFVNSWYGGISHFITNNSPWIRRGGSDGDSSGAGITFFLSDYGYGNDGVSTFRVVLAPE